MDETDLVMPLHEGVHETPCWQTFLGRLRRRARADSAALVVHQTRAKSGQNCGATFASGDIGAAIEAIRLQPIRPSRVYGDSDIGGAVGPLRVVRIDEPEGRCSAWMIVARARHEFGAGESAVLSGLVPHAAIALRSWATLDRLRAHAAAADAALARLGGAWIAIEADGRIADLAPDAAAALRATFGMTQPIGERLPMSGRGLSALTAARDTTPRLITLSEQPVLHLLVAHARVGTPAALLGYLRTRTASLYAPIVAELFGLTLSEARLAAALAKGATLAEAAITLGLTVETARNYSKRLYAKTGAHGQADIVRLILGSVAAFA